MSNKKQGTGRGSKTNLVREYAVKFPQTPNLKLAKIIYEQHKDMFKSIEDVRSVVRYVRGASGARHREKCLSKLEEIMKTECGYKYEILPPLQLGEGKWLILADIHIPFQNEKVIDIALDTAKKQKITGIILNGDIVDCYQFSFFVRQPDISLFKEERKLAVLFLEYLRNKFPKARIIWKDGNHDNRILNYICQNAPAIWDEEYFSWQKMLKLDEYKIEYVKSNQWLNLGKLTLLHGHEFGNTCKYGSASSVNPARGLFLKTKSCSACAHHHQTSQHNETTVDGSLITTWSLGCLCTLHPMYCPITKWNWGFGICEVDKRNIFKFKNYRILGNYELVD